MRLYKYYPVLHIYAQRCSFRFCNLLGYYLSVCSVFCVLVIFQIYAMYMYLMMSFICHHNSLTATCGPALKAYSRTIFPDFLATRLGGFYTPHFHVLKKNTCTKRVTNMKRVQFAISSYQQQGRGCHDSSSFIKQSNESNDDP